MIYYNSKTFRGTTVAAIRPKVEAELKKEGFGKLTEIDIQATTKKKLGKDYLPHLILVSCNPGYADKVISTEPAIGTMLPCNVTLRELENGDVEIAIIDPFAAMGSVGNIELEIPAKEVQEKLVKVLNRI